MPNHIKNELHVSKKVLDALVGDDGDVDFNNVIQMPEGLGITAASTPQTFAERTLLVGPLLSLRTPTGINSPLDLNDEYWDLFIKMLQNYRSHKHFTWYEWCLEKWGTKWNAYDSNQEEYGISFNTAWSAPFPVIHALSVKFPDENIRIRWADEDIGNNVGDVSRLNGTIVARQIPKGGSKEAYDLAFEIRPDDADRYILVNGEYEYKDED